MLKQKIQSDLNNVIKSNEEISRDTLRMLLAAISNKEKEKRYKIIKEEPELDEQELIEKSQLTDEQIIEVVSSEVKKRKEAALEYQKGERRDLAEKERAEIKVLEKYLPEQLSEPEIKKLIEQAIKETEASQTKDIGKVMAELMPKIKGKADGGEVSRIVKELLD